jgi:hypothetical protein
MEDTMTATGKRPYLVDAPIHKVQTVEWDGDVGYLFRHDFTPLNASNLALLLQHENDTVRVTEQVAKGQFRSKSRSEPADANLYRALIQSGGWRPAELESYRDEESIPPAARGLYAFDENSKTWEPGWNELTKDQMAMFTAERMSHAVANLLRCRGEYMPSKGGIDFMFEQGGLMRVRLDIGDYDEPAYQVLLEARRPESKQRTRFRENFAFAVDHRPETGKKNDFGKTSTVIDLEQAVKMFDGQFTGIGTGPEYSQVVFLVPPANGGEPTVAPYSDERRSDFLSLINPMFKVEVAAAMVQAFAVTDRELQKR